MEGDAPHASSSATTCASPTSSGPTAPATDAYLVVANWPDRRRHHWQSLLLARGHREPGLRGGREPGGRGGRPRLRRRQPDRGSHGRSAGERGGPGDAAPRRGGPGRGAPTPASRSPCSATVAPDFSSVSAADFDRKNRMVVPRARSPIFGRVEAHMMRRAKSMTTRPAGGATTPDPETAWTAVLVATRGSTAGSSTRSARPASSAGPPAPRDGPGASRWPSSPRRRGARAAGFRPCRRCRPETGAGSRGARRWRACARTSTAHLDERLTLARAGPRGGPQPRPPAADLQGAARPVAPRVPCRPGAPSASSRRCGRAAP